MSACLLLRIAGLPARLDAIHRAARMVACLLLLALAPRASAFNLPPTWRWSNPLPNGTDIYDLIYSGGTYIEVGELGQVFTSSDGQTWYPTDTGVTNALRAATYLGGRLVITGENGLILISDDLVNFYSASQPTTDWLEGVAASTNLAMAVGDNGVVYTSTNGVNWNSNSASASGYWLSGVAYGTNNTFVAVGEDGFIATSANGTAWTKRTSNSSAYFNGVAWLGNEFLAVASGGKAFTSPDGATWTAAATGATNDLYTLAGTNNSRLAAGYLALLLQKSSGYSNQLSSALASPAPSWSYYAAACNGSNYVVAGDTGLLTESFPTNSLTGWSTFTTTVTNLSYTNASGAVTSGTNSYYNSCYSWLWDVAHLQNRTQTNYVAVGNNSTILTSPNGINWEVELPALTNSVPITNAVLLGVGGSTNLFLITGNRGTVWWSTNFYLWNAVSPAPTANDLQGIWFDGTRYLLCGGSGTILSSVNGTNWTARTSTTNFLMSIAQISNSLVVVGENGTILTSPDATNWTKQASGTTNWLSRVRYLNGELMAVGEYGTILTSANGTSWSSRTSGTTNWLNALDYVDGAWFIAGNQGTMLISTNGVNWINSGTITSKSLYGLVINSGQLVTVGAEGVIIRSQVIPAITPVAINNYSRKSGQNIFLFTGQPDQRFYLQRTNGLTTSTNFSWLNAQLMEFYDGSGTLLYLDSSRTNSSTNQFYRTVTAN